MGWYLVPGAGTPRVRWRARAMKSRAAAVKTSGSMPANSSTSARATRSIPSSPMAAMSRFSTAASSGRSSSAGLDSARLRRVSSKKSNCT